MSDYEQEQQVRAYLGLPPKNKESEWWLTVPAATLSAISYHTGELAGLATAMALGLITAEDRTPALKEIDRANRTLKLLWSDLYKFKVS